MLDRVDNRGAPGPQTLHTRLAKRDNALNLVRLVLAASVIVGHAQPLTGSDAPPSLAFVSDIAVNGFFAASGYLIAASRTRLSFMPYLGRRILRIFPGFLVCLSLIAAVLGPIAAYVEGNRYNWPSALGFVFRNASLWIQQRGINGTLESVPYPEAWNGSLWTLSFEFLAYLLVGLLLTGRRMKGAAFILVPSVFVLVVVGRVLAVGPVDISTTIYLEGLRLGGYFLAGAVLFVFSHRVALRAGYAFAAVALYLILWQFDAADLFGQLPLAYLVLSIGAVPWTGIASKTDLSYGVYIYAFPIQQLLVVLGTEEWGMALNALITLGITLIVAWLSWRLVEKPAMSLKDLRWAIPW